MTLSARLPSLLLIASAILLLLALSCSAAPASLYDTKVVPTLDSASFRSQLSQPVVTVVAFCTARNGKCRDLAPHYAALSKQLQAHGIVVAGVDCNASGDICAEHEATDAMPLVKLFPGSNSKPSVFKGGKLSTKDLAEWVWGPPGPGAFPNRVVLLTSSAEKKSGRQEPQKARVLLFTEKRESSPLYRGVAYTLTSTLNAPVVLAEVRKPERALWDHYGVGKGQAVILVEPPVLPGQEPRGARRYEGKMDRDAIIAFIQSFLPQTDAAAASTATTDASAAATSADSSAAASEAVSTIPELRDQSCVDKHCGGGLCIVMLASGSSASAGQDLAKFELMAKAVRGDKSVGKFQFVWANNDASVSPSPVVAKWAEENFDVQAQEYPQLILLASRKGRFAKYVGAFTTPGVLEFAKAVTKGSTKTVPFFTRDNKLSSLPTDTTLCPPDAPKKPEEKKPAAPSQQQAAVQEDGELQVLTSKTHDDSVMASVKPWVILFHHGQSHAQSEAHKNLTADFDRVAKNLKDMVLFGMVDVATSPDLASRYGLSLDQFPVIKAIPHGDKSKMDLSAMAECPAEDMLSSAGPKALRSFALKLLDPATEWVLNPLTSASMQSFMQGGPGASIGPDTPFGPKFILFAKPSDAESGVVVVPDLVKALALEFSTQNGAGGLIAFGVASSRERDLARQFNVTRIPAVFTMLQGESTTPNQISVSATGFEGPINYINLQRFCQQVTHTYQQQKTQWAARAARQQQQQQQPRTGSGKAAGKKQKDTAHDEL